MSLDRQSIEKRDFPISRRGYETVAVDEHLARIASDVEALQAAAPTPAGAASLATSASERIRGIVEAAETTAAEIERAAREDAAAARSAADADARSTRQSASSEAQAHVAAVQQATAVMLERVGSLESEVIGLLTQLRASADEIGSGLATLHAQVSEVGGLGAGAPERTTAAPQATPAPVAASGAVASAPVAAATPEPELADEPEPVVPVQPAPSAPLEPVAAEPVPADPAPAAAPVAPELPLGDPPAQRSSDAAGARMVALNLVLDGVPRDEIEAHLDERYALEDRDGLLDELYAKQGG